MKIALTGARGSVGQAILKYANEQGHYVFEINRRDDPETDNKLSEHRFAEGTDYDQVLKAFKGADAVIHVSAIPDPKSKPDHMVHNNNVSTSYIAMRAAAELGIKRVSIAGSVNALGLEFSRKATFESFPITETSPTFAEDSYSLSKWEAEQQADSLCRRYENLRIATFRIHEVEELTKLKRDLELDKKVLWSYSDPREIARACVLGVTVEKDWKRGHERFYCVAPFNVHGHTQGQAVDNETLAKQNYPDVPIKGDLTQGFFSVQKIYDYLGWKHEEPKSS